MINYYKYYRVRAVVILIFTTLLISNNLCWFNYNNTRPNVSFPIPYGWEYNQDSGLELYSSIDYPDGMYKEKARIVRPLIISLVGNSVNFISSLAGIDDIKTKIGIAYILHRAISLFAVMFVVISVFFLGEKAEVSPKFLFFATLFLIIAIVDSLGNSTKSFVMQLAIPAIYSIVFYRLFVENDGELSKSTLVNIVYAVLCGILLLQKQVVSPVIGILGYMLYSLKLKSFLIWSLFLGLPFLFYRYIVYATGHQWYNHEIEQYGQGVWFFSSFMIDGVFATFKKLSLLIQNSSVSFFDYYGFMVFFLLFGFIAKRENCYSIDNISFNKIKVFAFMLIVGTYIQAIAANRVANYMFSDSFVLVSIVCGAGYDNLVTRYKNHRVLIDRLCYLYIALCFVGKLLLMLHLPWVHPFAQLSR